MKDVTSLPLATDGADLFRNADLMFAFVVAPDASKSMVLPKLTALNDGLQAFIEGRPADVTLKRQDIAIVPFGQVKPLLPQSLATRPMHPRKSRGARRRARV